jgi:hypothetical protein
MSGEPPTLPEDPAKLVPLEPGQTPLRWQMEAMLSIRRYLPEYADILVSAATGTGKGTLIASLVVKAFRAGKRTLFLVHRDELIDDVMKRALAIEPNLSAGKVKGDRNEWAALCVFASVQTLQKKRLLDIGRFDFVITDESHHATAKTYQAIYARVRENNERAKHIGFTATPFRSGKGGKTTGIGDVFKILCYEYSLQDAITDGVLCPLVCKQIETHLDLTDVDPDDEDRLEKLVDTPDRNRIVAEKYNEHRPGKQAIIFGVSIAHAKNLAAAFKEQGVNAEPIWGTDRARAKKIAAFKAGTITVLCNKDLLTEGFDHRPVEFVGLVRPTESRGLFAQMIGRGTRRSADTGKVDGFIADFVANSKTHDLVSTSNLSTKVESQRIEVGSEVRHKRIAEFSSGVVTSLSEDGQTADVLWSGIGEPPFDPPGPYPCDQLVLVRPPRAADEFQIVPKVAGVSEFEVMLFGNGARQVAWYTYDSSTRGKIKVARGQGMSVIVCKARGVDTVTWDAWLLRTGQDGADLVATGAYAEVFQTACGRVENPMPYDLDWQRDPATDRQIEVLRKFNIRRDKLSKGEASMLLEIKIGMLRIARVGDGR